MEIVKGEESGFVIKTNGGYFEVNGLGGWTLAGSANTAEVFPDRLEAEETIKMHSLDNVEILRFNCKFEFTESSI